MSTNISFNQKESLIVSGVIQAQCAYGIIYTTNLVKMDGTVVTDLCLKDYLENEFTFNIKNGSAEILNILHQDQSPFSFRDYTNDVENQRNYVVLYHPHHSFYVLITPADLNATIYYYSRASSNFKGNSSRTFLSLESEPDIDGGVQYLLYYSLGKDLLIEYTNDGLTNTHNSHCTVNPDVVTSVANVAYYDYSLDSQTYKFEYFMVNTYNGDPVLYLLSNQSSNRAVISYNLNTSELKLSMFESSLKENICLNQRYCITDIVATKSINTTNNNVMKSLSADAQEIWYYDIVSDYLTSVRVKVGSNSLVQHPHKIISLNSNESCIIMNTPRSISNISYNKVYIINMHRP